MCQDLYREAWGKDRAKSDMPLPLCFFFLGLEGIQMETLSTWRRGAEGVGRGRGREGRPAAAGLVSSRLQLAGAEMISHHKNV